MAFAVCRSLFTSVLFMACCSTSGTMTYSCSKTSPLTGYINSTDANIGGSFIFDDIQTSINKGQTLCYDLMVEGDGIITTGRRFFISFLSVKQRYVVEKSYDFSVPVIEASCTCECFDSDAKCNPYEQHADCKKKHDAGTGNCWQDRWNIKGPTGCYNFLFSACCSVIAYTESSLPDYTAILLEKPVNVNSVNLGFIDEHGNVIGKVHELELKPEPKETVARVGTIRIEGLSVSNSILKSSWYFTGYLDRVLRTGPLNEMNEMSTDKLGWYKFNREGLLYPLDRKEMRKFITPDVESCIYKHNDPKRLDQNLIGHKVSDIINKTVLIDEGGKHVDMPVDLLSSALIQVKINASLKDFFSYQSTDLKKFVAIIRSDSDGNQKLHLWLSGASGSLFGSIEHANSPSESIKVFVASAKPIDTSKVLSLATSYYHPTKVCLHAKRNSEIKCVIAAFEEEEAHNENMSLVKNFQAEMVIDHAGNWNLRLFLSASPGKLFVSVERSDSTSESLILYADSNLLKDTAKSLHLSSSYKCPNRVCIYTGHPTFDKCVVAPCTTEKPGKETYPGESDLLVKSVMGLGIVLGCFILIVVVIAICYVRRNGCQNVSRKKTVDMQRARAAMTPNPIYGRNSTLSLLTVDTHLYADLEYVREIDIRPPMKPPEAPLRLQRVNTPIQK